jgi:hypothetical protein
MASAFLPLITPNSLLLLGAECTCSSSGSDPPLNLSYSVFWWLVSDGMYGERLIALAAQSVQASIFYSVRPFDITTVHA